MEQKINIAELLKDCPNGMELDCLMYDNVSLMKVDDDKDAIYPIRVFRSNGCLIDFTKYGQYSNMNDAKCVIFPKGKTTWEGFVPPCKFKNGDILATEEEKQKLFQAIKDNGYKWNAETKTLEKLVEPKFKVGDRVKDKNNRVWFIVHVSEKHFNISRIPNPEGEGSGYYVPIEDQDEYELVPDKFDITTLVPFESRVLVRDTNIDKWKSNFCG